MKKSLIALAVAGALTAPIVAQADATLYGSFRAGLVSQDNRDLDLRDESTRIGIKGDVDLGLESTKGLFHWEANINTTDQGGYGADMFAPRLSYMGATGNWGTALIGRQYHPHYTMVVSHTNIFNSADKEFGEAFAIGNNADKNGFAHKRNDNTLAYASPVMGGFQVVAGAVIAGESDDSRDDVDGYNIGAQFTGVEGLRVSASYGATEEDGAAALEQELWGLGASYKMDAFSVAARYEDREVDQGGVTTDDRNAWELAGGYTMGATTLKARYGDMEIDSANVDGDQWGLEVEQKLGNKGRVWVGYTEFDDEIATALNVAKDTLVLGYRLDF
ncbi:MAG: porin [Oceanospirillales bacterium]|uniref:Putative porin n=1 Tax=Marinobacterium halophilum TaxID=267374 RepID=A0A2P8EUX1_9GAMM|nr:porin [Marinobacterium halophilum]MBR9827360.1 porin [Oceanospirillales bacterium]PSL13271.1 putative porin [Marinobacterium halophilum]